MAGTKVKFTYGQLHTIKHAVIEYLKRDGISEEDRTSETWLLKKIENEIEDMKTRHNIIG